MLGAEDRGTIAQRDTYFEVALGGLKLREGHGQRLAASYHQRSQYGAERLLRSCCSLKRGTRCPARRVARRPYLALMTTDAQTGAARSEP
jgi:hypothetical protein